MRKLLLADASAMMHRIIELTFSRENVHVISVRDGDHAIALLPLERPDIVLVDHALPIHDGYEVAAFVKTHSDLEGVPVLLMAGAFEPVDNARAEQAGCDGVLVKPFEPQEVVARVRELIDARTSVIAVPTPVVARASVLKLVEPSPQGRPGSSPTARPVESVDGWESLDEYFDRLDAALGGLEGSPGLVEAARLSRGARADRPEESTEAELPTVEALLGAVPVTPAEPAHVFDLLRSPGSEPMATERAVPPAEMVGASPQTATSPTDLNALAEALGGMRRSDVRLESSPLPVEIDGPSGKPIVTDETIDEITRRVAQRLVPSAVSRVVSNIVTEVAERLVREEIERMREK